MKKIRTSAEYWTWRNSVFKRDWYICQKCKRKTSKNNAHHILNFAKYEELRFDIDNWITLCEDCHKLFHKIYWNNNNDKKQIFEFINEDTLEM